MELWIVFCLAIVGASAHHAIHGPFTSDFVEFLDGLGLDPTGRRLDRPDLAQYGSFGGKMDPTAELEHDPVVFVHGNSDIALRRDQNSRYQTGWDEVVRHFMNVGGYKSSELYATTWGDANSNTANQKAHTCEHIIPVRHLLDAVLAYSGHSKVDVIAHSMGVTIARKAIRGGRFTDSTGRTCELGDPINDRIDTFVSLAGANYGLCNCQYSSSIGTCNSQDGFFPGSRCGSNTFCGFTNSDCEQNSYSALFEQMNTDGFKEGQYVFSFYSETDEILGTGSKAWGKPTARMPIQDGFIAFPNMAHMDVKDETAAAQLEAVLNHRVQ
jgi:hypothetical protein